MGLRGKRKRMRFKIIVLKLLLEIARSTGGITGSQSSRRLRLFEETKDLISDLEGIEENKL